MISIKKNKIHVKYKEHRNLTSTLLKRSKRCYFTKCFNDNFEKRYETFNFT